MTQLAACTHLRVVKFQSKQAQTMTEPLTDMRILRALFQSKQAQTMTPIEVKA